MFFFLELLAVAQFVSALADTAYTACFKKNFTLVFQMLLYGECYENVYTEMRTNYPLFKVLNDG
jgi:hypothetical protein